MSSSGIYFCNHVPYNEISIKILFLTLVMEKWQKNILQDLDFSLPADPVGGEPFEDTMGFLPPPPNYFSFSETLILREFAYLVTIFKHLKGQGSSW